MLFNSFVFPIFLLVVWGVYLFLQRKPQNLWLLAASYFFYGWWDWRFCSLLAISTVTDYFCALLLSRENATPRFRKRVLYVTLCTNLGILGFFKYFNFFADSFGRMVAPFGFNPDFVTLNILLPIGISFYTFQTMAYTIDVYLGKEKACRNFWDFSLYVAYFPPLVAGPIERAGNLIPQLQKERQISTDQIYSGIRLIFWGFFLKLFVADGVAPFVNRCFANPTDYNSLTLLCGAYLFALQIYGDFAGYTNIARGVSRLFGIELCLNFRQPYLSTNISDFWRRWHISLSSWLRDYLYISLGGNRKGKTRTYINLMLTMLLGGLWHGAAWTFIIWGALHGAYLAIHKFATGKSVNRTVEEKREGNIHWQRITHFLSVFLTFNLVCFAWIFFRADSLSDALAYLVALGTSPGGKMSGISGTCVFYMIVVFGMDILCERQQSEVPMPLLDATNPSRSFWQRFYNNSAVRGLVYMVALLLLVFIGSNVSQPFVYFQF